jgi:flagellar protein FliL
MADKDDEEKKGEEKKGGKSKMIIMLLPTLLLVAGAGWYFLLRSPTSTEIVIPKPTAGAVTTLDPITINLAGGHFLKVGMAMQMDASAGEEADGSKLLDLAISEFSGKTLDELASTDGRDQAKDELIARMKFAYLPETSAAEAAAQTALKDGLDAAPAASAASVQTSKSKMMTREKTTNPEGAASTAKSSGGAEASSTSAGTGDMIEPSQLTGDQVVAAAGRLTVLPMAYNLYFTEFVMQ